ncbi:MAG: hypothetical protein HON70_06765 [Lentisphaerae bacterium]|nr:hypothetical protein [Lentisphaerota bacterium]
MIRQGYQHMVLDHYVDRLRSIRSERAERLAAVHTKADALAYQTHAREAIQAAFSPRPEKGPLNSRVVDVIERAEFRIEKVLFESRPGCVVTANVYVPAAINGQAPAVIGPCGHSGEGKACDLYSAFGQRLALNGFIALIYDPFNQGERDQYFGIPERECVSGCCAAHNMMGKQLELLGEYFGMWRAWDGMRALDLLLERPDVDPAHLGVTGNSGGGTMSTWLWGAEDRLTMAAPSCFVTTFLSNLENELPADCEQYPPGVVGAGLDMADFIIAQAPKPVILLGQTFDYFDRRGLKTTFAEARQFYSVFGAEDNVANFIGPQGHGYSIHNQQAMLEFFCKQVGRSAIDPLPDVELFPEEQLRVTPEGEVVKAGAKPIFSFIADTAGEMASSREQLTGTPLRAALADLLGLPKRDAAPHYRVPRPATLAGDTYARYAVETEGHIRALLRKRLVDRSHAYTLDVESNVLLYLPHACSQEDVQDDPHARDLNRPEALYTLDVRGLGETGPEVHGGGGFFQPYGMDYMMHGQGILLGEGYLGRRVHDVLAVLDLLVQEGAESIALFGRGQGAVLALYAGVLHDSVTDVTVKNAPLSYHDWLSVPLVAWPSANFLRDGLRTLDLVDCYRELAGRIHIIEPWDASIQPVPEAAVRQQLAEHGIEDSALLA